MTSGFLDFDLKSCEQRTKGAMVEQMRFDGLLLATRKNLVISGCGVSVLGIFRSFRGFCAGFSWFSTRLALRTFAVEGGCCEPREKTKQIAQGRFKTQAKTLVA